MIDPVDMTEGLQRYFRFDHYRASSRDVDLYQRLRPGALCAMMQESAWRHAESLDFGFSHLDRAGKFWALSRLTIQFHRLPVWGDEFDLETWPSGNHGAFALRDMRIFSSGVDLASMVTGWLVVDRDSRRPLRPRDILTIPAPCAQRRALAEIPARISPPPDPERKRRIRVGYTDLDLNGHVNNTRYVDWMQDCFDQRHHADFRLARLDVNFISELHLGENLEIFRSGNENGIWILEGRVAGEKPVVRGRFHWVPAKN